MNPVVTLAVCIATGTMHWFGAICYVASQLTGGILGAALTRVDTVYALFACWA